ncbi:MAG: LeuA family protein [Desulfovibrionaceae bacterium]
MLIDTTLREGAQTFGVYFRAEARRRVVAGLMDLGVEEIELGWVGQEGLGDLLAWARRRAGAAALSLWSPCREPDVRRAAALGADRVNLGLPVSDAHLRLRLGLDRAGLLARARGVVAAARAAGLGYVSVGLEDVSRADRAFALEAARAALEAGACRIRLSDTAGVLAPWEAADLAADFRRGLGPGAALAVHCHDDFGMATANACSALHAGADFADGSLLGLGERSGIAATEELAAHLALRRGRGYRLAGLRGLCAFLAEAAGVPLSRIKAVAGRDVFASETGLHVQALEDSAVLFEPYAPAMLGAERTVALGGKSGRGAVRQAARRLGVVLEGSALEAAVRAVRDRAEVLGRPLTLDELSGLLGAPRAAG